MLPSHSVLAGALVLTVINVVFFLVWLSSSLVYDGDLRYYVIAEKLVNTHLEKAASPYEPIPRDKVLDTLVNQLRESDEGKALFKDALVRIEEEVRASTRARLRPEMDAAFTTELFRQLVKSYLLLESLRAEQRNPDEVQVDRQKYFNFILDDFVLKYAPAITSDDIKQGADIGGNMYMEVLLPRFNREFLTRGRFEFKHGGFEKVQQPHDTLVKYLRHLEAPPAAVFDGDGIVINAGGAFTVGAIISIIQLREVGSVLPIELMLNTEAEYDAQICEELLPKLNAKCQVLERLVGKDQYAKLGLKKFQLKVLGLLFSSFNNVIALDTDNLAIKNPDALLSSEPFTATKFVLWPDIWHKGLAPMWYELARIPVGPVVLRFGCPNNKEFSEYVKDEESAMFHDLQNTIPPMGAETGQMVFSKREHWRLLVLALYYNVYGPQVYYRIMYQGTYGSGDRETFVPALHVMNEPYHLNEYKVWFAGFQHKNENGKERLQETTLVQNDPSQTREYFDKWRAFLREQNLDTRLWPFQDNDYSRDLVKTFEETGAKSPDVMFLHMHRPKPNPVINNMPEVEEQFGGKVYTRRFLGTPGAYPQFGSTDWELKINAIAKWVVCEGITSEKFWKDVNQNQWDVCDIIGVYVTFLKEDTNDEASASVQTIDNMQ